MEINELPTNRPSTRKSLLTNFGNCANKKIETAWKKKGFGKTYVNFHPEFSPWRRQDSEVCLCVLKDNWNLSGGWLEFVVHLWCASSAVRFLLNSMVEEGLNFRRRLWVSTLAVYSFETIIIVVIVVKRVVDSLLHLVSILLMVFRYLLQHVQSARSIGRPLEWILP